VTPRFADTYFFVALLADRDQHHARVTEFARQNPSHLTTTRWVLTELANALAGSTARQSVATFLLDIEDDPAVTIVGESDALYHRGLLLYSERPDKRWSLTDCISFLVMGDKALREALTEDHHFAQAGFTPVFAQT
jgi:predicted nucleic acid-binding protein